MSQPPTPLLQPIAPQSMRLPSGLKVMRTSDLSVETTSGSHSCAGLTSASAQANGAAAFMPPDYLNEAGSAAAVAVPLLLEALRCLVRSCFDAQEDGAVAHGGFVV